MTIFPTDRLTAQQEWWCDHPDSGVGLWAYTDRLSYQPGDTVSLHIYDASASRCKVRVVRAGAQHAQVYEATISANAPATATEPWRDGCGWPETLHVVVDDSWPSGGYVVEISRLSNPAERSEHWFAVRPAIGARERIALIACTCTWTAYNGWGGANHYQGVDQRGYSDGRSPELSLLRPWSRGTVWLPAGAPRKAFTTDPPMGWTPRYPTLEWALASGYPKNVASAGWATYEGPFVRWAEQQGYAVDVLNQYELATEPEILAPYRCAAIVGHDEYWSWEMRDAVDAWVDDGGHLARFAGNFMWQVRFDPDAAIQTCYKFSASEDDPAARDPQTRPRTTASWDDPVVGRPAALTMGLTGNRGVYVRSFAAAPRSSGGYTVYRPRHWVFSDCDLYYGDQLGAGSNVFSYEVDGLDYTITDGLPYATGADGIDPETVDILAMGLASMEEDHGNRNTDLWGGDAETRYKAEILYRDTSPEAIDRASRGNGMMVIYRRGRGSVFNAGSCEWVNGLITRDQFIERTTQNVLDRFLAVSRNVQEEW